MNSKKSRKFILMLCTLLIVMMSTSSFVMADGPNNGNGKEDHGKIFIHTNDEEKALLGGSFTLWDGEIQIGTFSQQGGHYTAESTAEGLAGRQLIAVANGKDYGIKLKVHGNGQGNDQDNPKGTDHYDIETLEPVSPPAEDPAYVTEFYRNNVKLTGLSAQSPMTTADAKTQIEALFTDAEDITWGEDGMSGTYKVGADKYSFTVTAGAYPGSNGKLTYTETGENQHLAQIYVVAAKDGEELPPVVKDEVVKAKVYLRYANEIPGNTLVNQPTGDFGPSSDNTPYFTVEVNLSKLNDLINEASTVKKSEFTRGNRLDIYYSAQTEAATSISKDQARVAWTEILSYMSLEDQAKFTECFGVTDSGKSNYIGYVLKRESDGWHIDGILDVKPGYLTEFYLNGTFDSGTVENKAMATARATTTIEGMLQADQGSVDWNKKTFIKDGEVYGFTVTSTAYPGEKEFLKYVEKGNNTQFYLAQIFVTTKALNEVEVTKVATNLNADFESQITLGVKVLEYENNILENGAYILDVIGSGNDYNFDFINDSAKLTMTVNGEPVALTKHEDNTFSFGDGQYLVEYYPAGVEGDESEQFRWAFNEDLQPGTEVKLTYSVKLTNPKTQAGEYGQYDADGSKRYDELHTNNEAVLHGNNGKVYEFPRPTVSYIVSEEPINPPPVDPPIIYPPVNPPIINPPVDPPVDPPEIPDDEFLEDDDEKDGEDQKPLPDDEHLEDGEAGEDGEDAQDPNQPKTGDAQQMTLWIAILMSALAGLGITIKQRKKL